MVAVAVMVVVEIGVGVGVDMSAYIPPPSAKNERELQRQIVDYLRSNGIEPLWHRTDKRTTCNVGTPDIIYSVVGKSCAMEVKFGKGKLSSEQNDLRAKLMNPANGWRYVVVRSLDEARAEFEQIVSDFLLYGR